VAEAFNALKVAPDKRAKHLAQAVDLWLDAGREPNKTMKSVLRAQAIDALKMGMQLEESLRSDPLAQLILGLAFQRQGQPREAQEALTQAYRLNPNAIPSYDLRPERLQQDLKLSDEETRLLRQIANQALRSPRGVRAGDDRQPPPRP
jgi:tetratricopeptide (TPR) repeat protein